MIILHKYSNKKKSLIFYLNNGIIFMIQLTSNYLLNENFFLRDF